MGQNFTVLMSWQSPGMTAIAHSNGPHPSSQATNCDQPWPNRKTLHQVERNLLIFLETNQVWLIFVVTTWTPKTKNRQKTGRKLQSPHSIPPEDLKSSQRQLISQNLPSSHWRLLIPIANKDECWQSTWSFNCTRFVQQKYCTSKSSTKKTQNQLS